MFGILINVPICLLRIIYMAYYTFVINHHFPMRIVKYTNVKVIFSVKGTPSSFTW